LIGLPGGTEDYLERLVASLGSETPQPLQAPAIVADHVPQFINSKTLLVNGEEIQAERFVIASGCRPRVPAGYAGKKYSLPLDVFANPTPRSAVVAGAGPVGVCIARRLAAAGCRVTLRASGSRLLPHEDAEIAAAVADALKKMDVAIQLQAGSSGVDDAILATGLQPASDGMDLGKAGVYVDDSGRVVMNDEMRTSNGRVFAAGAVTGPPFHLAFQKFQAEAVAENLFAPFFARQKFFPEPFPRLIPFDPPIASIGLAEHEAVASFKDARSVKVAWEDGLIKLVGRRRGGELLGAHLFMRGAAEAALFFDLVLRAGLSLSEVADAHHFPSPSAADRVHASIEAWLTD
jgi:pyruvate/2-oxoglutarate dehydrogenase complex dihydrolipoamide dehydrogenase (E3) component